MSDEKDFQLRAAGMIAYLEGRHAPRGADFITPTRTLEDLDRRLRNLEISHISGAPPLVSTPSWETIAWRVIRLEKVLARERPIGVMKYTCIDMLLPDDYGASIEEVEAVILDIASAHSSSPPAPLPKPSDEKERIHVARQRLLFLVGTLVLPVKEVPISLREMYVVAIDASFNAKGHGMPPAIPPPPPPELLGPHTSPFGPRLGPRGFPRRFYGCCSCACHHRAKAPVSISDDSSFRGSSMRRKGSWGNSLRNFCRFRWMRCPILWKRKPAFSDTSSGSSRY